MEISGIVLISPYTHRAGHHSSFTRVLYKYFTNKGVKTKLITYSNIKDDDIWNYYRSSELLPQWLKKIINSSNFDKFFETSITNFVALITLLKYKNYIPYFIDGSFLSIFPFGYFFPGKKYVAYLHTTASIVKSINKESSLIRIFLVKISWDFFYKALSKDKILLLTTNDCLRHKPYLKNLKRIKIVNWGIDSQKEFIKIEKSNIGEKLLLFGPNHPGKNYDIVFKAWNLSNSKPPIIFAGKNLYEGNDPYILGKLLLKLNKLEIINDYIPDEEIMKYFLSSKTIILSYEKSYTGTCSIINFALKFGIPVIASDSSGVSEIVNKYNIGFTFNADNQNSLAEAIDKLYSINDKKYNQIRQNCLNYFSNISKKNNWNDVAKNHLKLIIKDSFT